ncbi:MAG: hypothetical protein JNG83_03530 [Opitutaceae bacterium]|nr:hypothetical protein [Opitutaceae bacterium]
MPAASPAPERRGVWRTSRNPQVLASPLRVPAGETWRYLIAYAFQVAPRIIGLMLNIKPMPGPGQDFPVGVDFMLTNRIEGLDPADAVPLTRNHVEPNPHAGGEPAIMVKNPPQVGFVPWGARRADGSPHPHAGTGFAGLVAPARPVDDRHGTDAYLDRTGRKLYTGDQYHQVLEFRHLRYDGRRMAISEPSFWPAQRTIDGYLPLNMGMSGAISDGDDLLLPLVAKKPGSSLGLCGVSRWQRRGGDWEAVAFVPITPEDDSIEPSLVRDLDGSLLFLARGRRHQGPPVRIWRQAPRTESWRLIIHRQRLTNSTPITLNSAVDGTPYLLMNLYEPEFRVPGAPAAEGGISRLEPKGRRGERSSICLLALNEARNDFATPLLARDPLVEFGVPPRGTIWAADHATATVVQLRDGEWHSVYGYRILEWIENTHMTPPSPQTGCYLDEAFSIGPAVPPWNF